MNADGLVRYSFIMNRYRYVPLGSTRMDDLDYIDIQLINYGGVRNGQYILNYAHENDQASHDEEIVRHLRAVSNHSLPTDKEVNVETNRLREALKDRDEQIKQIIDSVEQERKKNKDLVEANETLLKQCTATEDSIERTH
jgi:L-ascorbate metabolism protein UlaG (beta-lactamase superfamily)